MTWKLRPGITQAKRTINWLLLNHFYPVVYRRVQTESGKLSYTRFGRSLWSAIGCQRKILNLNGAVLVSIIKKKNDWKIGISFLRPWSNREKEVRLKVNFVKPRMIDPVTPIFLPFFPVDSKSIDETKLIWNGRDQATAEEREKERERERERAKKRKEPKEEEKEETKKRHQSCEWPMDRRSLRVWARWWSTSVFCKVRQQRFDDEPQERMREREREREREIVWRREERHVAKREAPPTVRISSRESPWLLECGPLGSRYIQVAQCRGSSSVYVYTQLLHTCTTWKNFRSSCLTRRSFPFFSFLISLVFRKMFPLATLWMDIGGLM